VTLVFSCNDIPKNYNDHSDAFYNRLIAIRFDNTIPPEKQDKSLKEKLYTELDGIMTWCMIGLKRLMENNWTFSETDRTRQEIKQYMTESSSVLQFVEECCVVAPDAECIREDLYNAFLEFNSSAKSKKSQIAFNKELEHHFDSLKRKQVGSRRTWKGIKLLNP
jgi:putative DNA primase/helicase